MSTVPSIAPDTSERTGPGRLVLVVGPSGAGKDTLMGMARSALGDRPDVVFVRRVVTRAGSAAEDNEFMTAEAFREVQQRGGFALHWEAHGHLYGLPAAMDGQIRSGLTVVANVSRTVIDQARCAYGRVTVVSITAPSEVLAQRVANRARVSDGRLEGRINRSVEPSGAAPDFTIINVGSADYHGRHLARIIAGGDWDREPQEACLVDHRDR